MNFTYRQLEAFLFSAKLRGFSAAAAKLHTTQSAISKRVAELEAQLGAQLLHRTARGLEVSQFGRHLMPLAEESQRLWLRIDHQFTADKTLRGNVRVGVTELIALTWLTQLIQRLHDEHPELTLEPVVDAGVKLFEKLEANQIDLCIMPGTYWGDEYSTIRIGQVNEIWVVSPKLKIPKRPLKPQEFALYPLIDESVGSSKSKFYKAWRAENGFQFGKVLFTNSTALLRELTVRGYGISQLSQEYVGPDLDAGRLRVVRSVPMPPMIYSAVYRNDNVSATLERIVELATQCCDFSLRSSHQLAALPAGPRRRTSRTAVASAKSIRP